MAEILWKGNLMKRRDFLKSLAGIFGAGVASQVLPEAQASEVVEIVPYESPPYTYMTDVDYPASLSNKLEIPLHFVIDEKAFIVSGSVDLGKAPTDLAKFYCVPEHFLTRK
jgi:hypothetical protein